MPVGLSTRVSHPCNSSKWEEEREGGRVGSGRSVAEKKGAVEGVEGVKLGRWRGHSYHNCRTHTYNNEPVLSATHDARGVLTHKGHQ